MLGFHFWQMQSLIKGLTHVTARARGTGLTLRGCRRGRVSLCPQPQRDRESRAPGVCTRKAVSTRATRRRHARPKFQKYTHVQRRGAAGPLETPSGVGTRPHRHARRRLTTPRRIYTRAPRAPAPLRRCCGLRWVRTPTRCVQNIDHTTASPQGSAAYRRGQRSLPAVLGFGLAPDGVHAFSPARGARVGGGRGYCWSLSSSPPAVSHGRRKTMRRRSATPPKSRRSLYSRHCCVTRLSRARE